MTTNRLRGFQSAVVGFLVVIAMLLVSEYATVQALRAPTCQSK